MKGSGWACDKGQVELSLDGQPFATIDCGEETSIFERKIVCPQSTGGHTVRAEASLGRLLKLPFFNGSLDLGCRQAIFEVVSSHGDPWADFARIGVDTTKGDSIEIPFDPLTACDVRLCDRIRLIQVARFTGVTLNSTRPLMPAEIHHRFSPKIDSLVADSGAVVDLEKVDQRHPYCDEVSGALRVVGGGIRADVAKCGDRPKVVREAFPDDILEIVMDFTVHAFCEAGDGAGTWLGSATWRWARTKGEIGHEVSEGSTSREPPDSSSAFMSAVRKFNARRDHQFPDSGYAPTKGGQLCTNLTIN